ncbi:hypothetical protein [Rossellomorea marisflavi]|uniref:hypothetical protein n=1 Tax=Rossellomorea marisflavi TaxID=189381 RepID=UPI000ACE3115
MESQWDEWDGLSLILLFMHRKKRSDFAGTLSSAYKWWPLIKKYHETLCLHGE